MAQFSKCTQFVLCSFHQKFLMCSCRDTEDVSSVSSLALGLATQYLTTTLVALALGFQGSWSLALVVLLTFPILVLLGGSSQRFYRNLLAGEHP